MRRALLTAFAGCLLAIGAMGEHVFVQVAPPRAVVDGRLVSAPGSAPGTFASAIMRLLAPERAAAIDENDALMAREWTVPLGEIPRGEARAAT